MPEQHRRQDDPEDKWFETGEAGGVWKWLAIFLAGLFVSLGASYFSVTRSTISREEAITIMTNYSPYNQDKALIKQELTDLQLQMSQMRSEINQLEIQVAQNSAARRRQ